MKQQKEPSSAPTHLFWSGGAFAAATFLALIGIAWPATGQVSSVNRILTTENAEPASVASCGHLLESNECVVSVKVTDGPEQIGGTEACHIKLADVTPNVLIVRLGVADRKILWQIANPDSPGLKFRFARWSDGSPGIDIKHKSHLGTDRFDTPEEEGADDPSILANPKPKKLKIRPLKAGELLAFRYNIQVVKRDGNLWVPCKVLDPVIVNRG